MALETVHNVDKGITRLSFQPADLEPPTGGSTGPLEQASPEHRRIFADYVEALRRIFPVVETWWSGLIDAQLKQGAETREAAMEMAFLRRIAGPAADPQFVALIRETWLTCDAHNRTLAETEQVAPQALLLGWLVESSEAELVRLVTCMPYWPVGQDAKGNWC